MGSKTTSRFCLADILVSDLATRSSSRLKKPGPHWKQSRPRPFGPESRGSSRARPLSSTTRRRSVSATNTPVSGTRSTGPSTPPRAGSPATPYPAPPHSARRRTPVAPAAALRVRTGRAPPARSTGWWAEPRTLPRGNPGTRRRGVGDRLGPEHRSQVPKGRTAGGRRPRSRPRRSAGRSTLVDPGPAVHHPGPGEQRGAPGGRAACPTGAFRQAGRQLLAGDEREQPVSVVLHVEGSPLARPDLVPHTNPHPWSVTCP